MSNGGESQAKTECDTDEGGGKSTGRRRLLQAGAAAVGATVAAAAVGAKPAYAVDGDAVKVGESHTGTSTTEIEIDSGSSTAFRGVVSTNGATAIQGTGDGNLGVGVNGNSGGNAGRGVRGVASGNLGTGVRGEGTVGAAGTGVSGIGNFLGVVGTASTASATGVKAVSEGGGTAFASEGKVVIYAEGTSKPTPLAPLHITQNDSGASPAHVMLESGLGDPRAASSSHNENSVVATNGADLWWCVGSGTPGEWRKVSGADTAGSFHATTPKRVWDTRFQGGAMSNGESRTISVADGRVLSSSAVDVPNLVPAGATAITFNLAVVNTSAGGFLAVTPGDAGAFTAASINWHTANSVLNNGTISTVDANRAVTVWCSGSTDFIIDITGYYL